LQENIKVRKLKCKTLVCHTKREGERERERERENDIYGNRMLGRMVRLERE
jgi:hypothetical protein